MCLSHHKYRRLCNIPSVKAVFQAFKEPFNNIVVGGSSTAIYARPISVQIKNWKLLFQLWETYTQSYSSTLFLNFVYIILKFTKYKYDYIYCNLMSKYNTRLKDQMLSKRDEMWLFNSCSPNFLCSGTLSDIFLKGSNSFSISSSSSNTIEILIYSPPSSFTNTAINLSFSSEGLMDRVEKKLNRN